MENQEEILDVLTVFEKKPSRDIPPVLEDYLTNVAKTGRTLFPWNRLKPLFIYKLEQVMEELNKDMPYDHLPPFPNVENTKYEDMKKRIIDALQRFNGAPFTVQRICELVTDPTKHYNRCDKFLRGIEKNVLVVSTVDPFGRKIVSDSCRGSLVNGLDLNGFSQQKADASDITDGQPFAPLPLTDWSSNSLTSVWPLAMGNGADVAKSPFSDQSVHGSGASDINQNNTEAQVDSVTDEVKCDSDVKYTDNAADSTESADSAIVQKDETSESVSEESEVTADSVHNLSGSEVQTSETDSHLSLSDTAPFHFETKDTEPETDADSTERSTESRVTDETSGPDSNVDTTSTSSENKETEDNNDFDGPPEKKMKMSATDEDSVSSSDKEISDTPVDTHSDDRESTQTVSEETKVESTEEETEAAQSTETSSPESEPSSTKSLEEDEDQSREGEAVELDEGDVDAKEDKDDENVEQGSAEESGEQGEVEAVVQDTSVESEQPDIVTTSEQEITNTGTEECPDTNEKESADSMKDDSVSETDNVPCKDSDDNTEVCTDNAKVGAPTVDETVNEAMETEQEDCQQNEVPTEISGTPIAAEDETEPMEQE